MEPIKGFYSVRTEFIQSDFVQESQIKTQTSHERRVQVMKNGIQTWAVQGGGGAQMLPCLTPHPCCIHPSPVEVSTVLFTCPSEWQKK